MNTEYEDLDLDDLLDISRTDAEYAGDMAEQARVLREMSQTLRDKVDLMRAAMRTLFDAESDGEGELAVWKGSASDMMRTELDRLYRAARNAPDVLDTNASSMDEFATRTQDTLSQIDQLHVDSKGHGADLAAEESDIAQARGIMQSASTEYLTSAESMEEPEFYNGLRKDPPEGGQGDWAQQHGPGDTALAPNAAPPPDYESANSDGVSLQASHGGAGQLATGAPAGTASPAPVPVASSGGVAPVPPPPSQPAWTSSRPTVRPVIGGRPGGVGPSAPSRPVPNPGGTVRPVIGGRDAGSPAPSRPVPNPGGTVRPVIGGRDAGSPAPSRPVPNPGGTVRPVIGGSGAGTPHSAQSETTARPSTGPRPGMPPYGATGAAPGNSPAGPQSTPAHGPREPFPTSPRVTTGRLAVDPRSISATGQRIATPESAQPAPKRPAPARQTDAGRTGRKKPAGQRSKKAVRQDGPTLERAIKRGTRRGKEAPGQEVFAKFAQQRARANPQVGAESDTDSYWYVDQSTVRAVIGGRRDPRFGTARS